MLGAELGRGGEGAVYEVPSDPALVAKIYHRVLSPGKAEKLSAMVRVGTPDLLKFSAWPISVLTRNRETIGLLMRRVARTDRPVHELYTPKSRLKEFPTASWLFLIHAASNIARGFASIHQAGHVIGDVNHGNVLVSANGVAAFIDCDSFQIATDGRIFLCEVGVSTYTPPELQGRRFGSVTRTQNHDAFGLAVLLFHLLFMGRHPFAGRFSGAGEMPIERAIAEFRFPYGRSAQQMQMSPPPNSLLLTQVTPSLAGAFEKSFSRESASGGPRTTALEWTKVLEETRSNTTRCSRNQAHVYFSGLSVCPWCSIEGRGIILFVDVSVSIGPELNVDALWNKLAILPTLGQLPPIPTLLNRSAPLANPEWKSKGRKRRLRVAFGILTVLAVVSLASVTNLGPGPDFVLIAASIIFAWMFPRELQRQRATAVNLATEIRKRYVELQNQYAKECVDQPFAALLQELTRVRTLFKGLPLERQRKLQELESNKYALQLRQFLDRFSINDATIAGIGPGRKQMLASYQVDTAADATLENLQQVPGIGPKFRERIMKWRQDCERRFRFDPQRAVAPVEIEKINREIRSRAKQLEEALVRGVEEAVGLHAVIESRRKAYLGQLESVVTQLAQAEANRKVS